MRFAICLLLSVGFFAGVANAQSTTIYNSSSQKNNKKTTLYNSKSSGSAHGGPLSIKNMLRSSKAKMAKPSKSYNPYSLGGTQGSGYALSMTPNEVRAKQAKDRARAQARKKEQEKRRRQEERQYASRSGDDQVKEATKAYTSRFQENQKNTGQNKDENLVAYPKKRKKSVYVRDESGLTMPQKVFGNIY